MSASARHTDPAQSHEVVASLIAAHTLQERIMIGARHFEQFDDQDVTEWLERYTGRRHQRNIVARARLECVRRGDLEELGTLLRLDRRVSGTLHFRAHARSGVFDESGRAHAGNVEQTEHTLSSAEPQSNVRAISGRVTHTEMTLW